MKGIIFDIKERATNDGPGIRTTVFFKGCPLACGWCLNPEIIEEKIPKGYIENGDSNKPNKIGKLVTIEEVWEEIQKDKAIYEETGGGVTISGGEPLFQIEFLQNILMKSKANNIHTVVDTTGFSSRIEFDSILQFTDLFLYDIKHLDEKIHKQFTGVSNRIILQNFESLIEQGKRVIVRFPLIPGFNDSEAFIDELIKYLSKYQESINEIQLLPFQQWAIQKYHKIKESRDLKNINIPINEILDAVKNKFIYNGFLVKLRDNQPQEDLSFQFN